MAAIKTGSKATPLHYKLVKDSSLVSSCLDQRWLGILERNKSMITTGLNPSMLTVIQQTWGWPVLMVFFNCESRTFALFSALLIRNKWVSLPHCDQGGVWYDRNFLSSMGISTSRYDQLYKALVSLAICSKNGRQVKIFNVLEFDFSHDDLLKLSMENREQDSDPWFIRSTLMLHDKLDFFKVINELSFNPTSSVIDHLPRGPRYKIRKAFSNGLIIRKGASELLHAFYSLYRNRIHQLGSFGLPYIFFQNLFSFYRNGTATIFICYHDGSPVGTSILLRFLDYSENMWFATLPEYNKFYPSYLLHFAMMTDAVNHGCKRYSMGRSTAGKGVQRYKSQFGGEEKNLYYSCNNESKTMNPSTPIIPAIIKNLPIAITQNFDFTVSKYFY